MAFVEIDICWASYQPVYLPPIDHRLHQLLDPISVQFFGKSGESSINGPYRSRRKELHLRLSHLRGWCIDLRIIHSTAAQDVTALIVIGGGETCQPGPLLGKLAKYFEPLSVCSKSIMIWVGIHFESRGRLHGQEDIHTFTCSTTANPCANPLQPLSLALVLLNTSLQNSSPDSSATASFETSVQTQLRRTASVDQAVLATCNGRGGSQGNRSVVPVSQVSVPLPQGSTSLL